jgi:hypothetical protein
LIDDAVRRLFNLRGVNVDEMIAATEAAAPHFVMHADGLAAD